MTQLNESNRETTGDRGPASRQRRPGEFAHRWGPWFWAPATILLLGVLSMAMLTWTDHISQRQRKHFAFANALMDLRISVATSHVWLGQGVANGADVDQERAWSALREALRLSELLLNGGESEHGLILDPTTDPGLRRRVEDLRDLVSEFGVLFQERLQRPDMAAEGSPLENRTDEAVVELERRAEELEDIVEEGQASDYARSRRLFLGIVVAWSAIVLASTTELLRRERMRRQAEAALRRAKGELEVRVGKRTRELMALNDELMYELSERKKAEDALRTSEQQLRHLSARLLTAQETERRRISTELHDDLGHSLVLIKLRLGAIEKELREEPSAAEEDCGSLSRFTDQVIDDVRRLSRDLRPCVLEDLGFSAALRWLADNGNGNGSTTVVSSIADVDDLVSPHEQLVLYRIIQEALTNAEKHAGARRVSLVVERRGDHLSFVVADDGKGFDPNEVVARDASERGLGLATMDERARMLGGSLRVWSEEGKGTRITLGVPLPNGGGPG